MGDGGDDMMVPDPVEVEQAEAAPLPNYDRRSGRVSNAAGKYIGAVRHTKVGEPGQMVCVCVLLCPQVLARVSGRERAFGAGSLEVAWPCKHADIATITHARPQ